MKNTITIGAALLLSTTAAYAGGLDRSGQGIGVLFEDGDTAELSFGMVMPSVSGVFAGTVSSGNVAENYNQLGFGVKFDQTEQLSFAIIMDQPFGANVAYDDTDPGYFPALVGASAELKSTAFTALARYKINENVSVHGGLRHITTSATITDIGGAGGYSATIENGSATGYVVGAAYERPDIALRVALTYSSETEFSNPTDMTSPLALSGTTTYTLPQSVNLDFQTGIAADTLLFGSIRWVDWTVTSITPAFYTDGPLVDYDNDSISYTLGVGRRFSDNFSGAISVGYEAATGDPASNLAPTDGNISVGLGGTYTMDNVEITGGVRYIQLGDATTEGIAADFSDNSALGVGLKVAFSF